MYNINITSKQTKLNKPKLNTAYGDGPKVDDTALFTYGSPSLLQVILIHATNGNIVVAKGAKSMM